MISETFTCGLLSPGPGSITMESMDNYAHHKSIAIAGYQFSRKVSCGDTWSHKTEKSVSKTFFFLFHGFTS